VNGVFWIMGPAQATAAQTSRVSAARAPLPLAVVLCPRGGRDLQRELDHFQRSGVQTLVSLLSHEQVEMLGLEQEGALAARLGMEFLHFPLPDHQLPPDTPGFRAFVNDLTKRVSEGEKIGIHCWGSIGRATVTAACTLIHLGWSPSSALAAVEEARGCPVPDTEEQERWILEYRAHE
jgi:protein-tyrosine phosphatase